MYLCLIFLPFLNFIFFFLFGKHLLPKGASFVSCFNLFFSFLLVSFVIFEVGFSRSPVFIKMSYWIDCELFDSSWGFIFDSLSVIMLFLIFLISSLVNLYSTAYMNHDPHQIRFLSFLSLFTFFMIMLITGDNFLQLFFGWEGVGLCSYLLINFWFTRLQANKAAIKAILINKIGDFGLVLGIFFTFVSFKTVDFFVVFSLIPYYINVNFKFLNFEIDLIILISFMFFLGVIGKSAQIGLHSWLPDAMEGPTPVSALIHAATMVTAGVFLLIRCSTIYEHSNKMLCFIIFLGSVTAFFAASIGIFQNDLKKLIAFSTCSQLGYMIFICGLSSYHVAIFYVVNHAYFKALLFLSAGCIIHSISNEQDLRKLGSLINFVPFIYSLFITGSFALLGFPFLSGFYSKDLVLEIAFSKYTFFSSFSHWLGLFAASMTSFYSFKLVYLCFLSNFNGYKLYLKVVYKICFAMFLPLFILCFFSIFLGFLTKDIFVGLGNPFWNNSIYIKSNHLITTDIEFVPLFVKWLPFFFSILGLFFCFLFFYVFKRLFFLFLNLKFFKKLYTFLNKKWFFDRIQNEYIASKILTFGYFVSYKSLDKGLFEFLCTNNLIFLISKLSKGIILLQSGLLNHYAFFIFILFIVLLNFYLFLTLFILFLDIHFYFILLIFLLF